MSRFKLTMLLMATVLLACAVAAVAADPEPHPVLTVTQWYTDWEDLHITVDNPSQQTQAGYLVVDLVISGQTQRLAYSITVPPDTTVHVMIAYPLVPNVTGVKIFEEIPDGVNEDQDPIAKIEIERD